MAAWAGQARVEARNRSRWNDRKARVRRTRVEQPDVDPCNRHRPAGVSSRERASDGG